MEARSPDDAGEAETGPPIAWCRAERTRRNMWRLVVDKCPFCGKSHAHGGGSRGERPYYGVRVAHCVVDGPAGYQLRPIPADGAR